MGKITTLVLATRNHGKVIELKAMLTGFPVLVKTLDDFDRISPIAEDQDNFNDNAVKKACVTAHILGLATLADDSGLVVDALDGAPGVYSARFAGKDATDVERCRKILDDMQGETNRKAAFECVIAIGAPSGAVLTYRGRCEGAIAEEPSGDNGFGYDPIFYYPPLGKTFAALNREEKQRVSHRGKAIGVLGNEFDKALRWIEQQVVHTQEVSERPKGH
ncbi:MAG: XTP/dITP diphosphatase [Desulfobacterales bacterium]